MLVFLLSTLIEEEKTKLEVIYIKYRYLMMYVSMGILKNKMLAEEAVQDSLINLALMIDQLGEINSHKTRSLVLLISERVSLNKLKYEKIRKHDGDEVLEFISSDDKSIDDIVIDKLKFNKIINELKQLNGNDFEIVFSKYYLGFTYREIAQSMELSESAIRKRCERAKKKVVNRLYEGDE